MKLSPVHWANNVHLAANTYSARHVSRHTHLIATVRRDAASRDVGNASRRSPWGVPTREFSFRKTHSGTRHFELDVGRHGMTIDIYIE